MTIDEWFASLEDMAALAAANPPTDPDDLLTLDHWLFLNTMLADDLDDDEADRARRHLEPIEAVRAAALASPAMLESCRRWSQATYGTDTSATGLEAVALDAPLGYYFNEPVLTALAQRHMTAGGPAWERVVLVAPTWVRATFDEALGFAVDHAVVITGETDLQRVEIASTLWIDGGGPHQRFADALVAADALLR